MKGTQANLTGELVKNLKIKLPSLPEQNKIASLLSSMDKLVFLLSL
ncbi:MAG: restriction endonuclease subunit S [Mycoplasmatales bacterium]